MQVIDAYATLGDHRRVTAWQPPDAPENRAEQIQDPLVAPMSAWPPQPKQFAPAPLPNIGPPPQPTNRLAIWSLVCAFVLPPLGVVLGHVALGQIKSSGQEGRGLAVAGLVCGYFMTAVTIIVIVLLLLAFYIWFMLTLQWVPAIPKD